MKLTPNRLYEIIPMTLNNTKDTKIEKRDRVFRYVRCTKTVAIFRHEKGGYLESWLIEDIKNKRVLVKEVENA